MIANKSFVLSASFPGSKKGYDGLRHALEMTAPYHFSTIEYYSEGVPAGDVAALLAGKRGIFLAGALQKAADLNPCSLDAAERERAIAGLGPCFHFARQAGAAAVMVSSGTRPANEADDRQSLELFADSLRRLHRLEPDLPILLEPGDRDVHFRQLLGHTAVSAEFTASLRREGIPLGLIFDMSHAAQLGEDLAAAWKTARPCCDHVHFANCVLVKGNPLYGDRHPFFEIPQGVYTHQDARAFLALLQDDPGPLTVSLEMICPAGENEDAFFRRLAEDTAWFFAL